MDHLDEFCSLVADQGVSKAAELSDALMIILEGTLPEWTTGTLKTDVRGQLMEDFACLNWMLAVGVWSNLRNARLRQDLTVESRSRMALATARFLHPDGTAEDVAAEAVRIDSDRFRPFWDKCLREWGELEQRGKVVDANSTLLIALEWILHRLGLSAESTGRVIAFFLIRVGYPVSIEEVAEQVVRAAERRRRAVWWNPLIWKS